MKYNITPHGSAFVRKDCDVKVAGFESLSDQHQFFSTEFFICQCAKGFPFVLYPLIGGASPGPAEGTGSDDQ